MNESTVELLELLAEHEDALERMYHEYADKLPAWSDFWMHLAVEESRLAEMIRSLRCKVEDGSIRFNPNHFSGETLRTSLDYVRGEAARAREQPIELAHALATARDVEGSLIEHRFFEAFDDDSDEVVGTLRSLAAAAAEHRDRTEEAWSAQR